MGGNGALPAGQGLWVSESIADIGGTGERELICPAGQRRLVYSVYFVLVTDATVAGRMPWIARTNTAWWIQGILPYYVNNASQTAQYNFAVGVLAYQVNSVPTGYSFSCGRELPFGFFWWPGLSIWIRCTNMKAGDEISKVAVVYERWLG